MTSMEFHDSDEDLPALTDIVVRRNLKLTSSAAQTPTGTPSRSGRQRRLKPLHGDRQPAQPEKSVGFGSIVSLDELGQAVHPSPPPAKRRPVKAKYNLDEDSGAGIPVDGRGLFSDGDNGDDTPVHVSRSNNSTPTSDKQPSTPPAETPPDSLENLDCPSSPSSTDFDPFLTCFPPRETLQKTQDNHSNSRPPVSAPKKTHAPQGELQPARNQQSGSPGSKQITRPKNKPSKHDKKHKTFQKERQQLAERFVLDLDKRLTDGQVSSLTRKTGGVRVVWSKTKRTTAGVARAKKVPIPTHEDGAVSGRVAFDAEITLASKIVSDEERLREVLAHEFCHLATMIIDDVWKNPHGQEFKKWGKEVVDKFHIKVTTKHSLPIDYKYIWECVSCRIQYKRHSKSIHPIKHRCGNCRDKLAQIKPAVRQTNPNKEPDRYQQFKKDHFQEIKNENKGMSFKELMRLVGEKYQESEAARAKSAADAQDLAYVAHKISTVDLDDDDE